MHHVEKGGRWHYINNHKDFIMPLHSKWSKAAFFAFNSAMALPSTIIGHRDKPRPVIIKIAKSIYPMYETKR